MNKQAVAAIAIIGGAAAAALILIEKARDGPPSECDYNQPQNYINADLTAMKIQYYDQWSGTMKLFVTGCDIRWLESLYYTGAINKCQFYMGYYQITGSWLYRGCTNPNATNHNPLANKDDGSCVMPTLSLIYLDFDEEHCPIRWVVYDQIAQHIREIPITSKAQAKQALDNLRQYEWTTIPPGYRITEAQYAQGLLLLDAVGSWCV